MNDAEFDRLPFKHAREALGCANPKTGTAYVRRTGIKALDAYVTDHELDELVQKHSEHEDMEGIRYKKGKNIFSRILPALAGIITGGFFGPIAGGLAAGGTSALTQKHLRSPEAGGGKIDFLEAGLQGLTGATLGTSLGKGFSSGFTAGGEAGKGLLGKLGSGFKGAAGSLGFNAAGGGASTLARDPSLALSSIPSLRGASEIASRGVQGGAASFANTLGMGQGVSGVGQAVSPSLLGGSQSGTSGISPTEEATSGVKAKGGVFESIQNVLKNPLASKALGAGIAGIGELGGAKTLGFDPSTLPSVKNLTERIESGALAELTPDQMSSINAQFDRQLGDARQAIEQRFKALRPGSDITNDTEFQKVISELEADFAQRKSSEVLRIQMGLTQQQTENLSQLANLDVFTLAQQAQISSEEAQRFKTLMADLGLGVAGLGDEESNLIQNIFGGTE